MPEISARSYAARLFTITLFAVAMGFFEAMVVVYLRELFYPAGFSFPLKPVPPALLALEIAREAATIVMLSCVAVLAAKRFWARFGYFLVLFGVWDVFYYIWLKAAIGWPATVFDWDILFLIPLPWIGPVIAPVLIALFMIAAGISLTRIFAAGGEFRPVRSSWVMASAGTVILLYSFMNDLDAGLGGMMPKPYSYALLGAGLALYGAAYGLSYRRIVRA